ncbi:DUF427 domain-containing protein [Parasphingopyxis sp.]|uniref:DUF427 domain-containing protein n=1 Tax=Parasphingopyxis sp. TaxID=1920299 RepID=UPI00262C0FCA|nr:DUF427 domain-containing protein [Parasphingopyxis sp.]
MPTPLPDKAALLERAKPYRDNWDRSFRPPGVEPVGEGEESVWDYPRPPIIAPVPGPVRVMLGDIAIAESDCALEVKETAGAPVPYIRPEDVRTEWLEDTSRLTVCEWKGATLYYDLALPGGNASLSEFSSRKIAAPAHSPSRPPIECTLLGGREGEWAGAAPERSEGLTKKPIRIAEAAWNYPDPFDDLSEGYAEIAGWFGIYAGKLDCFIGEEKARPQPGNFYGGWVTDRIKGPIKGGPGTGGW